MDVRAGLHRCLIANVVAALYEADKKAHEEAIRNGGVRVASFTPFDKQANALTCVADPVLVWNTQTRNRDEPCDLHLAEP